MLRERARRLIADARLGMTPSSDLTPPAENSNLSGTWFLLCMKLATCDKKKKLIHFTSFVYHFHFFQICLEY